METEDEKRLKEFDRLLNGNTEKDKYKDMKLCTNCGRRLIRESKNGLCPMCYEQQLFNDVRDYIRANDVKDYDVAEKFGIPLSKVKEWIRQGRIQYRDDPTMKNVIMGNYCQICGAPTSFGTICPKCMKEQKKKNMQGVAIGSPSTEGNSAMRFIDDDKK